MRAPSEPVKNPSADVEEFARNVARMMEEGGKALAAYLKPREEGRAEDQYAEVTDVVKTLGQVADYWLRDPQRALAHVEGRFAFKNRRVDKPALALASRRRRRA